MMIGAPQPLMSPSRAAGRPPMSTVALPFTIGDGGSMAAEPVLDDDPARHLHQQDLRRALDRALGTLSPKIRTTFVLFAELGLTYKDIAETQKIPIGTVMSRINATRKKLQQILDWDALKGLD